MRTPTKIFFAIVFAVCGAASTQATPILGAQIFVQNTGHVTATFTGSDAMFDNLLLLASPPNGLGTIFEGHVTPGGTTVDLGVFTAGTELVFELNNQVGGIFYTGPASRNPDNLAHAVVDFTPGHAFVGFEDTFGGGDRDYNDLQFSVSDVGDGQHSVPDGGATAAMLLGVAVFVLVALRRFA